MNSKQCIIKLPNAILSPSWKKNRKKYTPKKFLKFQGMVRSSSKIKKFLVFQEMELSGSNIKRFLIFSQKKAFLIFREMKLFIFQETKTRKSSLYFRKGNFVAFQKTKIPKKCFIFQETELSYISGKRKLSNIFSGKGYSEPWHIQNIYFRIFNPSTSCLNPQFFP